MVGCVNEVNLLGNVGSDPDIRSFPNGGRVANLRIATSQSWKDKNTGEKKERVEWHSVTVMADGLVGVVEQYVRKGSKLYVKGQLQTRKWQDQSGQDRYTTEIVIRSFAGQIVLLSKPDGATNQRSDGVAHQNQGYDQGSAHSGLDDEIPF